MYLSPPPAPVPRVRQWWPADTSSSWGAQVYFSHNSWHWEESWCDEGSTEKQPISCYRQRVCSRLLSGPVQRWQQWVRLRLYCMKGWYSAWLEHPLHPPPPPPNLRLYDYQCIHSVIHLHIKVYCESCTYQCRPTCTCTCTYKIRQCQSWNCHRYCESMYWWNWECMNSWW